MPFTFTGTEIPEVKVVEYRSFPDNRGFFAETYKKSAFEENGIKTEFPQDNLSFSRRGVLRGLHFQKGDRAQGKLVMVPMGEVFDVAVDIRKGSSTYGKYVSRILSSENLLMLWIPPGFAHGYQAVEDSIVHYKATSEYAPGAESGIIWNDSTIAIDWPIAEPILSGKDMEWGKL